MTYTKIDLCLAAIFWQFESSGKDSVGKEGNKDVLKLFETSLKDVKTEVDFFVLVSIKKFKTIRIKVKV